eukprot:TRINITY_DN14900_c0_g1_i1.p1 TRINITY_DN14900_c0_g1~~TRINITY_DN14900_c0_g1_i1.p1  ORF type:complete len:354 (+),score=55.13 TRINITY_DN14900_c0_g1_i1:1-1062(+)
MRAASPHFTWLQCSSLVPSATAVEEVAMAADLAEVPCCTLHMFMLGMLLMGAVNMVMLKFQTMQEAPLTGELLCLPVYLCLRWWGVVQVKEAPKWIFLVPCCCDLIATSLLCMGLTYIAVSVAQMCRGTIVVFVCLLSYALLGKMQRNFQICGVALVTSGIACVSLSTLTGSRNHNPANLAMGMLLCVFAQTFQASMFVYEEKIMSKYSVEPLQVVGMEGLFGVGITASLLMVLSPLGFANLTGAIHQISSSEPLLWSVVGSCCAASIFNFCGAKVTQKASSVARTTVRMSTTILVWFVELAVGWNTFSFLQLLGFIMVAWGTLVYNRIIVLQLLEPLPEAEPFAEKQAPAQA